MRLVDAPAGAVLRDRDGDVWVRRPYGARRLQGGVWTERELAQVDENYGPMVLLVPVTILRDLREALTAACEALAGPRDSARDLEVIGRAQAALAAADRLEP